MNEWISVLVEVLRWAGYCVSAAVAALAILAPLTKTDRDNKVLRVLRWLEDLLHGLALPNRPEARPSRIRDMRTNPPGPYSRVD